MAEHQISELELSISTGKLLLGRYRVGDCIGQGAQATLYKAEDVHLNRIVALKVFSIASDETTAARFKREAQIIASLDHPNIVKTFAFGILDDGRNCMALEYVEGCSLSNYLKEKKQLSIKEFLNVFDQTLSALEYLHEHSVLHRDLKPDNILCAVVDERIVGVKLSDFGIAKVFQDISGSVSLTQTKSIGTAAYMSPEQCKAQAIDRRADLYAISCVMFESLYGRLPFEGSSDFDTMYKQMNDPVPDLHELPPSLGVFISKGLQKDPAQRFQTAEEMRSALASSAREIELGESQKIVSAPKTHSQNRKISPILIFTLILLSTGLLTLYLKSTQRKSIGSDSDAVIPKPKLERVLHNLEGKKGPERVKYAKSILLDFLEPGYWQAQVKACDILAASEYSLGNYETAIAYAQQALSIASTHSQDRYSSELVGDAYRNLAARQRDLGKPGWRDNLNEASAYFHKVGSPSLRKEKIAGVNFEFGHGERSAGDYKKAAMYFNNALTNMKEAGKENESFATELRYALSEVYFRDKKIDLAMSEIPGILKAAQGKTYLSSHAIGWLIGWADDLANAGRTNQALGLTDKAQKIIEELREDDQLHRDVLLEVCRGDIYRISGDTKKALEHYKVALAMYRKVQTSMVSNNICRLGTGFSAIGEKQLAVESWKLAIEKIEIGDTKLGADQSPQLQLAYFYQAEKDYPMARSYCDQALQFLQKQRPDQSTVISTARTLKRKLRALSSRSHR
ncbi:MAG: serine/threonine-protein kinase [Candidatus Obscuribacterales bacterium]|nr:serine/threonine-protein kinase [Candidatus Obscuribacterales bacterium]